MGKYKTNINRIQNSKVRHLTFYKRKKGLLKKAMELSAMCDVNVLLCIFNANSKKCAQFSTLPFHKLVKLYENIPNQNISMFSPLIDIDDDEGCKKIVPLECSARDANETGEINETIKDVSVIKNSKKCYSNENSSSEYDDQDSDNSEFEICKKTKGTKRKRKQKSNKSSRIQNRIANKLYSKPRKDSSKVSNSSSQSDNFDENSIDDQEEQKSETSDIETDNVQYEQNMRRSARNKASSSSKSVMNNESITPNVASMDQESKILNINLNEIDRNISSTYNCIKSELEQTEAISTTDPSMSTTKRQDSNNDYKYKSSQFIMNNCFSHHSTPSESLNLKQNDQYNKLMREQRSYAYEVNSPIVSTQMPHFTKNCFEPMYGLHKSTNNYMPNAQNLKNVMNSPPPAHLIAFDNSILSMGLREQSKLIAPIPQYRQPNLTKPVYRLRNNLTAQSNNIKNSSAVVEKKTEPECLQADNCNQPGVNTSQQRAGLH